MKLSTLSAPRWVDNSWLQETSMLNVTGAGSDTGKNPNPYYYSKCNPQNKPLTHKIQKLK